MSAGMVCPWSRASIKKCAAYTVGNSAVTGDEDSTGVTIKASITTQAELLDLDPETFSKAAYVGRFGWVSADLRRVDLGMLEQLLRDAWRSTAPKKLLTLQPE